MSRRSTYTDLELNVADDPSGVYIDDELTTRPIECPAGEKFMDQASYPACHCKIEKSLIKSKTSPNSYKKFCAGDFTICPSWRAKWDMDEARRKAA